MNLIAVWTTRIIFDDTEVIGIGVGLGVSGEVLEFLGGAIDIRLGSEISSSHLISRLISRVSIFPIFWARNTRKFELILYGPALFTRVATLRNFRIVRIGQEGSFGSVAFRDPNRDDGNLGVVHAQTDVFIRFCCWFDILFLDTLGFSK